MFGITEFSAIINPPQCSILAVGGGKAIIGMFQFIFYCTLALDKTISIKLKITIV